MRSNVSTGVSIETTFPVMTGGLFGDFGEIQF